jgi:hypothetical protein
MNEIHAGRTREFCPICHRPIEAEDACESVPVCPLVYPDVEGLRCHSSCLEQERERNRFLRPEDLRPTFLRRRVAKSEKEDRATVV